MEFRFLLQLASRACRRGVQVSDFRRSVFFPRRIARYQPRSADVFGKGEKSTRLGV